MMYNAHIAIAFLIDPEVFATMDSAEFGRQVVLLTKAHPWKADNVSNAAFELVEIKQFENQTSHNLAALVIVLEAKSAVANSVVPRFETWVSDLLEAARVFCPVEFEYAGISHQFDYQMSLRSPAGGTLWATFAA